MKPKHLVILYGGPSSEREVSFGSKDFFLNLYKEFNPILCEWGTDRFFYYLDLKKTEKEFVKYLRLNGSVVIIASHGEFVEDGYIQKLFEKNKIKFTGSRASACKLAMDKVASQKKVKEIVEIIPTFSSWKKLKFPFIAKPINLGSSVGVFKINNQTELSKCLKFFKKHKYVFQPFIEGTELTLGTVRTKSGYLKLFPTEIIPKGKFFDYDSKYKTGGSIEITPARISKKLLAQLQKVTNKIHETLGLGYYSRSDFILAKDGTLYYLETNTLPGMTKTSLIPQQLEYVNKVEQFKKGLLKHLVV